MKKISIVFIACCVFLGLNAGLSVNAAKNSYMPKKASDTVRSVTLKCANFKTVYPRVCNEKLKYKSIDAANKDIKKTADLIIKRHRAGQDVTPMEYKAHIYKNVLSIAVSYDYKLLTRYKVYNINLKDGSSLSQGDVLKLSGYDKKYVGNVVEYIMDALRDYEQVGAYEPDRDEILKKTQIRFAEDFRNMKLPIAVDSKGNLKIIARYYSPAYYGYVHRPYTVCPTLEESATKSFSFGYYSALAIKHPAKGDIKSSKIVKELVNPKVEKDKLKDVLLVIKKGGKVKVCYNYVFDRGAGGGLQANVWDHEVSLNGGDCILVRTNIPDAGSDCTVLEIQSEDGSVKYEIVDTGIYETKKLTYLRPN